MTGAHLVLQSDSMKAGRCKTPFLASATADDRAGQLVKQLDRIALRIATCPVAQMLGRPLLQGNIASDCISHERGPVLAEGAAVWTHSEPHGGKECS